LKAEVVALSMSFTEGGNGSYNPVSAMCMIQDATGKARTIIMVV
jgi:hypothetical protein